MKCILAVTTVLAPLLIYPYVSRTIEPTGIGKVNFAYSVIWYFMMISSLGIPNYGIRACAQVRDDRVELSRTVQEILIINLITCLFSYFLFFISICLIPQFEADRTLFIVMSLNIICNVLGVEWFYSGIEQFGYMTIRSIVFKLLMIAGVFLFIHKKEDYVIYGALYILGTAGSGIVNFINLRKYIDMKPVGKYNFKRHFKPIAVFFGLAVATTIYTQMDATMLGFIKGTIENGYYDAAVKIKNLLSTIVTSLGAVLMPRAAYYLANNERVKFDDTAVKSLNFTILVALSSCVFFMIFAKPSILFLSGEMFVKSITPMRVIMPSMVFIAITNITGMQIMVPLGREKYVLYSSIAGAAVNIIVNALLIPTLGATGAAIGTVAAELVVLVVQFFAIKDVLLLYLEKIAWGKVLFAILLASVASCFSLRLDIRNFLVLLIGAFVFGLVLVCSLIVLKEPTVYEVVDDIKEKVKKLNNS